MMIMNENMLNMLKELDSEFPDNYGLREGLRIDAIDLKDRYDDDIDFDEELLDELRIYYKNKTILIKRYDRDNCVFGAYKTMDDLLRDIGDYDDVLVHAEINVL